MANTRSSGGSRHRDAFRDEVSSLLADLGELAAEPAARPVPPPTGSAVGAGAEAATGEGAATAAEATPAAELATGEGAATAAEAAPAAELATGEGAATAAEAALAAEAAPGASTQPAMAGPRPAVHEKEGWPGADAARAVDAEPAAEGGGVPGTPPVGPATEWAAVPEPPAAAAPEEIEDLPSFSPSYLPPLPPAVSAATPQPDRWVSPFDPEPPPPPPDWPLMKSQPGFERLVAAEPDEPTVPPVWPDVPISGTADEATGTDWAGRRHPVPLPTAWPAPPEPSGTEVPEPTEPEAAPGIGGAEGTPPAAMDTAPEHPPPGLGSGRGWRERPSPAAVPSSGPPVLPGWVLRSPRPSGAEGTPLAPASQTGRGWEVRESPPVGVTPSGEPLDHTAAAWGPETESDLPSAAGSEVSGVGRGPAPEGVGGEADETPSLTAAATPPSRSGTAFSLSAATAGPPSITERPILPLIPGGMPSPVSTRAWSLAAAMESLEPLAPPSPRSASVSPAEPPAAEIVPAQPTGASPPFPVMVTVLFLILVVIVVLIVTHHG